MLTFEVKTNIAETIKKLEEMQRGLATRRHARRQQVRDQAKTQMSKLIRETTTSRPRCCASAW